MTPLRKRMTEDLQLKGYAPSTQQACLLAAQQLAKYYHQSPEHVTEEQLRAYFLYLRGERQYSRGALKIALAGIKFLFEVTLQRAWPVLRWARAPRGTKLPVVLSRAEVRTILGCVRAPVYRVCLQTIYSCGLRISEGVGLQVGDVDSQRMLLRVCGKGNKQRDVPLAQPTLEALRALWKIHRTCPWLFPAQLQPRVQAPAPGPIEVRNLRKAFHAARQRSGVTKRVCVHSLRHAYATHLLETGVALRLIQEILGHRSPRTTAIYTHLTDVIRAQITAPLHELAQNL